MKAPHFSLAHYTKKHIYFFKAMEQSITKPRSFKFILIILSILIISCTQTKPKAKLLDLPNPGFEIEQTRSDPNRPVRETGKRYKGPLFDAHVHLDPSNAGVNEELIQEVADTIKDAGVISAIFMPVPNEGILEIKYGMRNGPERRKVLKWYGGSMITLFCGSDYISNSLHKAYHKGYNQSELDSIYKQLAEDLDDPECSGIGEIGLYHFNKTGHQNIIEYSPTLGPFYKIIGMVAEKGVWLDLHAEPVDPNGQSYEAQVFGGLKLLFDNYPDLKLILSHTAMTNPKNLRAILKTYPGIMVNFKPIRNHSKWRNLEPITNSERSLYEDWASLFEEMPERFIVGSDYKFGRAGKQHTTKKYIKEIKRIKRLLGVLNPEAAELIAYKNAQRIFK